MILTRKKSMYCDSFLYDTFVKDKQILNQKIIKT